MASIALSETPLTTLKKLSLDAFKDVKSAHLSESLASALGYRTHAALIADLPMQSNDPAIVLIDDQRFTARLQELGYSAPNSFSFEDFIEPRFKTDRKTGRLVRINQDRPEAYKSTLISTHCYNSPNIKYTSERSKAWRNLMVAAVNEALRQKLFSLRPDDNRWQGSETSRQTYVEAIFTFDLPNGMPVKACVTDAGFGEIKIDATARPDNQRTRAVDQHFAGALSGYVWVERRRGAWLQSCDTSFHGKRALTPLVAELDVQPTGYGDRGRVIL